MARSNVNAGSGRGRGRAPVPPPSGQGSASPRRFVQESWGELRKVQWPTGQQVLQGTLVVGFVTVAFALYLSIIDQVVLRIITALRDHF